MHKKILVGKENRPLGRTRCTFDDNIRKNRRARWLEGVDRIETAQERNFLWDVLNMVINYRGP